MLRFVALKPADKSIVASIAPKNPARTRLKDRS
jgi:hypothetical protein